MGKVRDLNIKNGTYYFDDLIDMKTFEPNLPRIDILIFIIMVMIRLRNLVIVKIFVA